MSPTQNSQVSRRKSISQVRTPISLHNDENDKSENRDSAIGAADVTLSKNSLDDNNGKIEPSTVKQQLGAGSGELLALMTDKV